MMPFKDLSVPLGVMYGIWYLNVRIVSFTINGVNIPELSMVGITKKSFGALASLVG